MSGRSSQGPLDSRKSLRLKKYPYQKPGCYYVTFATKNLECLFGEVVDGEMRLNKFGAIAKEEWQKSGSMRPGIELDEFVIMPNHIHGLIRIKEWGGGKEGRPQAARTPRAARNSGMRSGSLGAIIGGFKAAVSSRIKALQIGARPIWHRNYYERIVRGERDLERIREYIRNNPKKWGAKKGSGNSRKNARKD